jgi:hypothetical protein
MRWEIPSVTAARAPGPAQDGRAAATVSTRGHPVDAERSPWLRRYRASALRKICRLVRSVRQRIDKGALLYTRLLYRSDTQVTEPRPRFARDRLNATSIAVIRSLRSDWTHLPNVETEKPDSGSYWGVNQPSFQMVTRMARPHQLIAEACSTAALYARSSLGQMLKQSVGFPVKDTV